MTIDLVYFTGCPNAATARQRLRDALARLGRPAVWREWDQLAPDAPDTIKGYGSPTVLVDGRDISGTGTAAAMACRADGGPTVEQIVAALERAT